MTGPCCESAGLNFINVTSECFKDDRRVHFNASFVLTHEALSCRHLLKQNKSCLTIHSNVFSGFWDDEQTQV